MQQCDSCHAHCQSISDMTKRHWIRQLPEPSFGCPPPPWTGPAVVLMVLALGPRAASSFLATSHAVVTSLPRTLEALQAGVISWRQRQFHRGRSRDRPVRNTTDSATPPAGHPPPPPKTNRPVGPHPPAGTTQATTRTGTHHAGFPFKTAARQQGKSRREATRTFSTSGCPRGKKHWSGSCMHHPPDVAGMFGSPKPCRALVLMLGCWNG